MARGKSGKPNKDGNLTLSDADIITTRVYGRRTLLRGFGAVLLGAGAIAAPMGSARGADTDRRELGDGKDQFADSSFRDPKEPTKDTDKRELGDGKDQFADSKFRDAK